MSYSEERNCYHCETYHLKNISFFAYWIQCKECGTYLCPQHSGLRNPRTTQYTFLLYLLVSYLFYFGIFVIFAPIKDPSFNVFIAYFDAIFLLLIPFSIQFLILRIVIRRLGTQQGSVTTCPNCNGTISVIYHDIFLYFWLFLIHVLYISTILNETGIFFYNVIYYQKLFTLSLSYVILLIVLIIFIYFIFKSVGGQILNGYKANTRVWLGEIFAIFLYISLNFIILLLIPSDDVFFSFDLFYYFTTVIFWYFPAFIIGSLIYKGTQKYLLNINKSQIIQFGIAILFIIGSFYIWGAISLLLDIYTPFNFYKIDIFFYSNIFNEILPTFLCAFLLGISIASILRKFSPFSAQDQQTQLKQVIIFIGAFFFLGYLVIENIYYFCTGKFLLDLFTASVIPSLLVILLIGILTLLIYEIISNWASSQTRCGKLIETKLGSLLYPILLGFLLVTLSLTFPVLVYISSSITIISAVSLLSSIFLLKLLFTVALLLGLIISFHKFFKKKIEI
ncbi:MAG: hypothetical protein ACTSYB_01665 [Candidatus Helarchaeota archaeon]